MKKITLIALLHITLLTFSQNRVNEQLPIISQLNGILNISTGWLKNESGQWISSKNKIPNDLGENQKLLGNYEKYSIGVDNFISFEIRDITINGETYALILKKYRDGFYRYETIEKDWLPNNSYKFYVLDKNEINKIKNIMHNESNNLQLDFIYYGDIKYINLKILTNAMISKEINKIIKTYDNFLGYKLGLNIKCFDDKKLVQFYFYEYIKGLENETDDKYYETTLANFNAFINID
jgi:hypothetical protein